MTKIYFLDVACCDGIRYEAASIYSSFDCTCASNSELEYDCSEKGPDQGLSTNNSVLLGAAPACDNKSVQAEDSEGGSLRHSPKC